MKKFLLSFVVFVASAAYAAYQYLGGGNAPVPATPTTALAPASSSQPQPAAPSTAAPIPATPASVPTTPAPAPTPKPQGQYADGSYTGRSADAYYGLVQVQATIRGGKLTDVSFLQYPSDRRTSQYINSQAMPLLRQEAIQAQSASVSGVSGASDTSAAFRVSLADALAQAKR